MKKERKIYDFRYKLNKRKLKFWIGKHTFRIVKQFTYLGTIVQMDNNTANK